MEITSSSPVLPKKSNEPVTMDFPSAMRALINGALVTRLEWKNDDYCLLQNGWLRIFTSSDEKFHDWLVSEGDMAVSDWVIIQK
jgi:hypothetical protein